MEWFTEIKKEQEGISFGQAEVEVMRNQARDILDWYDNMKNLVPKWYRKNKIHIKQIKPDKSKENIEGVSPTGGRQNPCSMGFKELEAFPMLIGGINDE